MTLEHDTITSADGVYTREVWLHPGSADRLHPLYVFLDGEFYLREVQAAALIANLMEKADIPPATCLFVSSHDAEARSVDYDCCDAFSRFIAEDVVAWIRRRIGSMRESGHVICGVSLGGLASAYTAMRHPEVILSAGGRLLLRT